MDLLRLGAGSPAAAWLSKVPQRPSANQPLLNPPPRRSVEALLSSEGDQSGRWTSVPMAPLHRHVDQRADVVDLVARGLGR